MHTSIEDRNYFSGFYEWDSLKYFTVTWESIILVIGPALLLSIVWYIKYSSDFVRQTLVNKLFSQICFALILACLFMHSSYTSLLVIGPQSESVCNFVIFIGRFSYTVIISLLSLHRTIRYLYIFNWSVIVSLNDDFFNTFLTWNVSILNLVFTFVGSFLGFHNKDLDYHLCRGVNPSIEINQILKRFNLNITNSSFSTPDPIIIYSNSMFYLMLFITFKMWLYSNKMILLQVLKNLSEFLKLTKAKDFCQKKIILNSNEVTVSAKVSKNTIVQAGAYLATMLITFVTLAWVYIGKESGINNYNNINQGMGRMWIYAGKMASPTIVFIVFPIMVISTHEKMQADFKKRIRQVLKFKPSLGDNSNLQTLHV